MIAVGSDHAGFLLKQEVLNYLKEHNLEYKDFGTDSEKSCNYPEFAKRVADAVASGECDRGILLCGTGIGMSMAANKVDGIRACACSDTFSARATRMHNNANILCMGQRVVGFGLAREILDAFLYTDFEGGRHQTRVDMITDIEKSR